MVCHKSQCLSATRGVYVSHILVITGRFATEYYQYLYGKVRLNFTKKDFRGQTWVMLRQEGLLSFPLIYRLAHVYHNPDREN